MNGFSQWSGALRRPWTWPVAITLLALVPLGCGRSGPELAPVTGKVTYKGQPVPRGTISFQPVDPKQGAPATGTIEPDGTYTMQTTEPGDGVRPGQYRVAITAREEAPILDYIPKTPPPPPKSLIPEKYENPETSGLTATVKSGRN
ncbi:MAG: hypothetical protein IRY99_25170, partial [Isosphaeraceae bacterium]|nr:hypothetical protein [Isosphaeraceae bacterium]